MRRTRVGSVPTRTTTQASEFPRIFMDFWTGKSRDRCLTLCISRLSVFQRCFWVFWNFWNFSLFPGNLEISSGRIHAGVFDFDPLFSGCRGLAFLGQGWTINGSLLSRDYWFSLTFEFCCFRWIFTSLFLLSRAIFLFQWLAFAYHSFCLPFCPGRFS